MTKKGTHASRNFHTQSGSTRSTPPPANTPGRGSFADSVLGIDRASEDSPGFEGLAQKKSTYGTWQSRFFWINNQYLNYGPDKKSVTKSFNLEDLTEVHHKPGKKDHHEINVSFTDGTKLNFKVDDQASANAWASAIRERHQFYVGGGRASQEDSFRPLPAPAPPPSGAAVTHESAIAAVDEVTAKAVEEMEDMKKQAKEAAGEWDGRGLLAFVGLPTPHLTLCHTRLFSRGRAARQDPGVPQERSGSFERAG